jgi:hypothetical protein
VVELIGDIAGIDRFTSDAHASGGLLLEAPAAALAGLRILRGTGT